MTVCTLSGAGAFLQWKSVLQVFPNPPVQGTVDGERSAHTTAGRLDAPAFLRLWHLVSLDAPTVAVVWTLAFAWAAGVRLPGWVPLLIVLVTWAVYIADRLFDSWRALEIGETHSLRERHLFHWRHRRIFVPVGAGAAIVAAGLAAALMPIFARERGSVLCLAAFTYFAGVHAGKDVEWQVRGPLRRWVGKELFVGILFTAACVLPAWNRAPDRHWMLFVPAIFFACLAWLNCCAIERWESTKKDDGPSRIGSAAACLFAGGILISACCLRRQPRAAELLLAGAFSSILLALLDRLRGRMTEMALRVAADLVLLAPAALLLR